MLSGFMFMALLNGICAQESAPPAPRPWTGAQGTTSQSAQPKVQANGSRLQVVGDAPAEPAKEDGKAGGKFVVSPKLRQNATGWSLGAFAGANLFQTTDNGTVVTQELLPGPILANVDTPFEDESAAGVTGGLKLRYTWPFRDQPIDQFSDEVAGGIRLSGALEVESFYNGGKLLAKTNASTAKVDVDTAALMMNFLLVGEFGSFRPYIGPGIGGALVMLSDYESPNRVDKDEEVMALAYQGIVGTDYFINNEWSIFGEYKYLVYNDLDFFSGNAKINMDSLSNHLVVFGLRKHF